MIVFLKYFFLLEYDIVKVYFGNCVGVHNFFLHSGGYWHDEHFAAISG